MAVCGLGALLSFPVYVLGGKSNLLTVSCVAREEETKSPMSQLFALIVCLSKFIECILFRQLLTFKRILVRKTAGTEELLFWIS